MLNHYYNPVDPTQPYNYDTLPENPTQEDIDSYAYTSFSCILFSIFSLIGAAVIIAIILLFSSCTTTKQTDYKEYHRIESMMDRMDSVINTKTVVQQDSSWRELIMHQFQSIRERNDTSHTFVVDSAGKVIKETLIIRTEKESNSETDRMEREVIMHRLETMDSTLSVMRLQLLHSDSLLQSKQKTIERHVAKPLSWWQKIRIWFGNVVLILVSVLAAVWAFRKRSWWLKLFRKTS